MRPIDENQAGNDSSEKSDPIPKPDVITPEEDLDDQTNIDDKMRPIDETQVGNDSSEKSDPIPKPDVITPEEDLDDQTNIDDKMRPIDENQTGEDTNTTLEDIEKEKLAILNHGVSLALKNSTTQEALEHYRKCLSISNESSWKLLISKCEMRRIDFFAQLIEIGLISLANRNIPYTENAQTILKIANHVWVHPYWIPKLTSFPVEISRYFESREI